MQYDPNLSVGFIINDVARLLRRNFDRKAQNLGLTRAQWQVLAHLKRKDGQRQNELADLLEVQPITLGRLVDRLEADGWVERRNDPEDRRAKRIFLTEKVAPVLSEIQAISAAVREEAQTGLAAEDRERLLHILLHMRENLTCRS